MSETTTRIAGVPFVCLPLSFGQTRQAATVLAMSWNDPMSGDPHEISEIRLSDEEIEQILDGLDGKESESANDVRRSQRHRLRGLTSVVTFDTSNTRMVLRVRLRNVSQHGVAFLAATPMIPGTEFTIQMPVDGGERTIERVCVARRCSLADKLIHEIGAEFGTAPPSSDQ